MQHWLMVALLGWLISQSLCTHIAYYNSGRNAFKCCLDSMYFQCDGPSVWLKDNQTYIETPDNWLNFQNIAKEEGHYQCSFKNDNGSFSPWGEPRNFYATDVTVNPQQIIIDASSSVLYYQHPIPLGRLTRKEKINLVSIKYNGAFRVHQRLPSNYSLTTRVSNNGNSVILDNLTIFLNKTELFESLGEQSDVNVTLQLRLTTDRNQPVFATTYLILDCRVKSDRSLELFQLNFTSYDCNKFKDGQVIEYLLSERTCLKSNFTATVSCSSAQSGVLSLEAAREIHIESIQNALQPITFVYPATPPTNRISPTDAGESSTADVERESLSTDDATNSDVHSTMEIFPLGILLKVLVWLVLLIIILLVILIIAVCLQLKLSQSKHSSTKCYAPVQQVSGPNNPTITLPSFSNHLSIIPSGSIGGSREHMNIPMEPLDQSDQELDQDRQPQQTDKAHVRTCDSKESLVTPNKSRRNCRISHTSRDMVEHVEINADSIVTQQPIRFNGQAGEGLDKKD